MKKKAEHTGTGSLLTAIFGFGKNGQAKIIGTKLLLLLDIYEEYEKFREAGAYNPHQEGINTDAFYEALHSGVKMVLQQGDDASDENDHTPLDQEDQKITTDPVREQIVEAAKVWMKLRVYRTNVLRAFRQMQEEATLSPAQCFPAYQGVISGFLKNEIFERIKPEEPQPPNGLDALTKLVVGTEEDLASHVEFVANVYTDIVIPATQSIMQFAGNRPSDISAKDWQMASMIADHYVKTGSMVDTLRWSSDEVEKLRETDILAAKIYRDALDILSADHDLENQQKHDVFKGSLSKIAQEKSIFLQPPRGNKGWGFDA